MEQIDIYLSMVKRLLNSKIVPHSLCLGNISKDWANDNMKKRFHGYIYDFNTDYNVINKSDILDIHKYLMKKKYSVNGDI